VVVQQKKKRGPGAPPGNMNAIKHGRYSRQFAELGALLASEPEYRAALLNINRRLSLKQNQARDVAALLLTGALQTAHAMSGGELKLNISSDDAETIVERATRAAVRGHPTPSRKPKTRKNNSPPDAPTEKQ
jgi:hypothetical protein